ncbi:MAG: ABC transporter permease [Salinarimonadaceae bacterium]|nr:MAG: ABC transporter permease [Salinarimonadaceae bacterium]
MTQSPPRSIAGTIPSAGSVAPSPDAPGGGGFPRWRNPAKNRLVRAYFQSPVAAISLVILVIIVFLATFAPWIAPTNPYDLGTVTVVNSRLPPGATARIGDTVFLLGSDGAGRDLLSAILYGLRTSIIVAAASTGIAVLIGLWVGLLAAYVGGRTDAALMRLVDLQLSFPTMLVALMLLAILGNGLDKIIAALVIVQWAYFARTARAAALVEREKEYMEAARGLYLGHGRMIFRHLMPNSIAPLIVVATIQAAHAVSLEATLSFLGLGLPPTEPSLGLLIANGFNYVFSLHWWISLFPGLALLLTIVVMNLAGDRLRDLLNPRLRK